MRRNEQLLCGTRNWPWRVSHSLIRWNRSPGKKLALPAGATQHVCSNYYQCRPWVFEVQYIVFVRAESNKVRVEFRKWVHSFPLPLELSAVLISWFPSFFLATSVSVVFYSLKKTILSFYFIFYMLNSFTHSRHHYCFHSILIFSKLHFFFSELTTSFFKCLFFAIKSVTSFVTLIHCP